MEKLMLRDVKGLSVEIISGSMPKLGITMFKIDLHIHTMLGGDSLIEPDKLVPRALEVGLDAVCVTEHNSYALSQPFEEITRKTGFPIFRGMEYNAAEGHLLIFGTKVGRSDLPPKMPIQRAIDWVNRSSIGAAIPAHPYQSDNLGRSLGGTVLKLRSLIALETINGSLSQKANKNLPHQKTRHPCYRRLRRPWPSGPWEGLHPFPYPNKVGRRIGKRPEKGRLHPMLE